MFFIVNKTKKHITLSDIKISLGPRQAIDLDKIMDRSQSENSRHLRIAASKGDVEIRTKDGKIKRNDRKEPVKTNSPDINKVKEEIIKEMKDEMKSLKNNSSNSLSREDLMDVMKELVQNLPSKEIISGKNVDNKSDEVDVEINEDLLIDINARAVEKRVKDVKMESVDYKEESKENTIINNIDELEDLLG